MIRWLEEAQYAPPSLHKVFNFYSNLNYHCLILKVKCSTNTFLTIDKIKNSKCIHDIVSYKLH